MVSEGWLVELMPCIKVEEAVLLVPGSHVTASRGVDARDRIAPTSLTWRFTVALDLPLLALVTDDNAVNKRQDRRGEAELSHIPGQWSVSLALPEQRL